MTFTEFKEKYSNLNTEEERKNFINNRIKELCKEDRQKIGLSICGGYNGFISPNMEVVSNVSGFFPNMTMDDLSIYEEFMNYISNDTDYLSVELLTLINVQKFVWKYFGVNSGNVLDRIEAYTTFPGNPIGISNFKCRNVAACSERSALVQNILKFLGFDSEIVFGKLNEKEPHTYIVFKAEGLDTRVLYDPMNPIKYYNSLNEEKYDAAFMLLTPDMYEALNNGSKIEFDYSLVKKVYGENNSYNEVKRVYQSDAVLYKGSIKK